MPTKTGLLMCKSAECQLFLCYLFMCYLSITYVVLPLSLCYELTLCCAIQGEMDGEVGNIMERNPEELGRLEEMEEELALLKEEVRNIGRDIGRITSDVNRLLELIRIITRLFGD